MRQQEEQPTTSGERLAQVLAATGMRAYRFAGYYAGFPLGEPIRQQEQSARGHRFRHMHRSLRRWLADDYAMEEAAAVEVVSTANRLLVERGQEPFPLDFLVTESQQARVATMAELRTLLGEVLERLARIERRL